MITTDQMEQIVEDAVLGQKPSIIGAEADAFRKELEPDIKLAKEKGWVIEVPMD